MDLRLEVVVVPVSDVDRAKRFYEKLGWRLDADIAAGAELRVVQFTPPGSDCSFFIGKGLTPAAPGSLQGLYLIVSDIEAARAEISGRGVEISEVFHGGGGFFYKAGREPGPDPQHASYRSFASFADPDGNGWMLQEITQRLPGRVAGEATYASTAELAQALRRAEAAHGEHEKRTGKRDENWPEWYAAYMLAEHSGGELPK
jgi:catechol 2,3-dioxygenase-like lactoylglutathione lyase family enzyme